MRSLYWKLGGALMLVVVVSVGLTAYLANASTTRQFQAYVQQGAGMYARNAAGVVSQFYAENRGWTGLQDVLGVMLRSDSDRLVVADSAGVIVADTGGGWLGKSATELGLSAGIPVLVSGKSVGTLYTQGSSVGRGFMGGRGQGTGTTPEQTFLASVNRSLIVAGVIAVLVALLLGLFLTRQVLKPVKTLTAGAQRIATGDLKYRAQVKSRDELGDLAQSFNTMASSLEHAEESRRQLNADIAHELRTPLTVIEGTVDGIIDGIFAADRNRLGVIKAQTALLTRSISDLRDLSLAESGQLKLDLKPTDLADLARRKLAEIDAGARAKEVRLDFSAPEALPEVVVDQARMEQVIANLLTNALRHTPPRGAITVSLVNADATHGVAGPHVLLSVRDNGEGIPAESLPHIFERFYRVDSSRARSEGGTGLGLAIVKQMVEAHGGRVWVESELHHGSTFYVAIPASRP